MITLDLSTLNSVPAAEVASNNGLSVVDFANPGIYRLNLISGRGDREVQTLEFLGDVDSVQVRDVQEIIDEVLIPSWDDELAADLEDGTEPLVFGYDEYEQGVVYAWADAFDLFIKVG
jgi:hypothetical protein